MGRRSRKRRASVAERIAASSAASPPAREQPAVAPRRRPGEPPRPPWHPFPLAELCIFVALIMGVVGFFSGGQRGLILLVGAMVLGSAATLEFTLREHLSGFRSHSVLLAGVVAVACGAGLFLTGLSRPAVIVVAAALFGVAAAGFRELFKRRSGGLSWRGGFR